MNDAGFALAAAYYTLLSALTYNSKPVAVYSLMAPDDAVAPYVILGPWTAQSDNTKDTFGQKGQINLDVVMRYTGNQVSKKAATEIANSITALLKPTPRAEVLEIIGFKTWNTLVEGSTDVLAPTTTDKIFRKVVTVSHSLTQL